MRAVLIVVAMLAALLVVAIPAAQADPPDNYDTADLQLTVLHNNDGESQLVNATKVAADFGVAVPDSAITNGGGIHHSSR